MAARLVDLERELRGSDDEVEDAGGSLRRGEERERLVADAAAVGAEVERLDELPAAGLEVAAGRVRVGALLELVAVERDDLEAAARLGRRLLDPAPLGRREDLLETVRRDLA